MNSSTARFIKTCTTIILTICAFNLYATIYTVTNTNDSGAGSFRQAIIDANANPGADIIVFNIPSGPYVIEPTSGLPTITDPLTIDGSSQPGQ